LWRGDLMRKLRAEAGITNKELSEILKNWLRERYDESIKASHEVHGEPAEAAAAGFYSNTFPGGKYEVIQTHPIEELLNGQKANVSLTRPYHKQAMDVEKGDLKRKKKLF